MGGRFADLPPFAGYCSFHLLWDDNKMDGINNSNTADTVATTVTNHGDDEDMSCLTEPAYPDAEQPDKKEEAEDDVAAVEEQEPDEEEPNWEEITQHEPARSEVPKFLSGRERKEAASDSYSNALDRLHDAVNKSAENLVEIVVTLLHDRGQKLVDIEGELTRQYVQNDKSRKMMEQRLEENARRAQGMFANLLKRVSAVNQGPDDDLLAQKKMRLSEDENQMMSNDVVNNNTENDGPNGDNGEPDWGRIMQHEPATTEVPIFLAGRERREAACTRFQNAIETYHAVMDGYAQELTQTVADLYNDRMLKLNDHEQILKQEFVFNDETRGKMLHNLQERSATIQNLFQELIIKVMLPDGQQQEPMEQGMGILTQATTLDSP